jgi:hypothetical protein
MVLEFVFELLINILLTYPGAGIRWLYYRGRKKYSKLLEDSWTFNSGVAMLFLIPLGLIIYLVL